ncbi:hypothetical protein [Acidihalobacter prosperus]|uniref:Uncharacterized protein n=1 Tax=Acidihalobacter prosperus TaxID=160660 RepID=A0A1A6C1Q9_9GAMM|nr:hypothetical protein [Acidihalobacter prosperus]OBS08493.1 hypothetical protein Thpro_022743 [Acidihalobacter prosperus]
MNASLLSLHDWLTPSGSTAGPLVLGLLLINTLLSLLIALPARRLIPARLRGHPVIDYATLTAMGTLIPILGPLLLLVMLVVLPRLEKSRAPQQPNYISSPAFAPEIPSEPSHFGVGGAIARLRNLDPGSAQGARALMAIENQRSANTTELLREALRHPDEHLRLLAHALIDQRESDITRMIRRLEGVLPQTPDHASGPLRLELAELHQELLYMGLAREGMSRHHQAACQRHLEAARENLGDTPRLLRIEGRLLQRSPRAERTAATYARALEAGAPPGRVLPYLAEIAWRNRDYAAIRALFARNSLFTELPVVGRIAERWRSKT